MIAMLSFLVLWSNLVAAHRTRAQFRTPKSPSQREIKKEGVVKPNKVVVTEQVVDLTPLFAGTPNVATLGMNHFDSLMCCCHHKKVKCGIFEAPNCRRGYTEYFHWHRRLRRRCIVKRSEEIQWLVAELERGTRTEGWHPQVWTSVDHMYGLLPGLLPRIKVYITRHGYSKFNKFREEKKGFKDFVMGRLRDATLEPLGHAQAMASQDFLLEELRDVATDNVQLAASLLSRAYDTLILATAKVWNLWDQNHGTAYVIHQVPALMEFGRGPDVSRNKGLLDFSPVRWCDSSLWMDSVKEPSYKKFYKDDPEDWEELRRDSESEISVEEELVEEELIDDDLDDWVFVTQSNLTDADALELATPGNLASIEEKEYEDDEYYADVEDSPSSPSSSSSTRNPQDWLTDQPWQVQAGFPRRSSSPHYCADSSRTQMYNVMNYLRQVALSGKTHVVLAAHSALIKCFFKFARDKGLYRHESGAEHDTLETVNANWLDDSGEVFHLNKEYVPNGATVTFDFQPLEGGTAQVTNLGLKAPGRGLPTASAELVSYAEGVVEPLMSTSADGQL